MALWFRRCVLGLTQNCVTISGTGKIMDAKKLLCFAVLASVAGTSHADNFFVNTNLGASQYDIQNTNLSVIDRHSHSEALRFGYQWNSDAFSYGLETGYANMGHSQLLFVHNFGYDRLVERIDGFMLGANVKYSLPMGFYISGRGGFFRSTNHQTDHWYTYYPELPVSETVTRTDKTSTSGMGSYFGVGVGYDFTKSFGVGLSYDRYLAHALPRDSDLRYETSRVDAYTLTAEYRF
jgi:OmpA-OmpF porin, OOP family